MAKRTAVKKSEKNVQQQFIVPPSGALRIIAYIICVMSPVVGFVLGTVFYPQPGDENKNFGRTCLILMAIAVVLWIGFMLVMMVFGALFSGSGLTEIGVQEGYY